jgi:hypothetical protein
MGVTVSSPISDIRAKATERSSLRAGAFAAARGSLDDGSELSLLAQLVSDAIGLGNMRGEVAFVLAGDGFAGSANVIDAGFFMIGRWLFGLHG